MMVWMTGLGRVRPTRVPGRPPQASHLRVLGQSERVFYIDAEIAHCALNLSVAQQKLHRPQITSGFVDDRGLCPP
jgi:hypothetical protein